MRGLDESNLGVAAEDVCGWQVYVRGRSLPSSLLCLSFLPSFLSQAFFFTFNLFLCLLPP